MSLNTRRKILGYGVVAGIPLAYFAFFLLLLYLTLLSFDAAVEMREFNARHRARQSFSRRYRRFGLFDGLTILGGVSALYALAMPIIAMANRKHSRDCRLTLPMRQVPWLHKLLREAGAELGVKTRVGTARFDWGTGIRVGYENTVAGALAGGIVVEIGLADMLLMTPDDFRGALRSQLALLRQPEMARLRGALSGTADVLRRMGFSRDPKLANYYAEPEYPHPTRGYAFFPSVVVVELLYAAAGETLKWVDGIMTEGGAAPFSSPAYDNTLAATRPCRSRGLRIVFDAKLPDKVPDDLIEFSLRADAIEGLHSTSFEDRQRLGDFTPSAWRALPETTMASTVDAFPALCKKTTRHVYKEYAVKGDVVGVERFTGMVDAEMEQEFAEHVMR